MCSKKEEKKEEVKEEILPSAGLYSIRCDTCEWVENRLDIMEKFINADDINDKYGQDSTSKSESDDDHVRSYIK